MNTLSDASPKRFLNRFLNPFLFPSLLVTLTLLTSACSSPPVGMRSSDVIGVQGNTLTPPDCQQLAERSVVIDAGMTRPTMAWGCATYTNLAAQIARPADFNHPREVAPADAEVAAAAVRRYRTNKVTPLNKETLKASN